MVNFLRKHITPTDETPFGIEAEQEKLPVFTEHRQQLWQFARSNTMVIVVSVLSVIVMCGGSGYMLSHSHAESRSQQKEAAEAYFDPRIVLKEAKITPAATEKNFILKDFDPCGNYEDALIQSGFDLSNLDRIDGAPHKQYLPDGTKAGGTLNVNHLSNTACFWILGEESNNNYDYITLQLDSYDRPPQSSERRVMLKMINGPENPPKPGYDAVYSASRYEIKGYTAFIVSEYDNQIKKRLCTLSFWPYLSIGATGPTCDKVKRLAYLILP